MKHNASITITRSSDDVIRVKLVDENSRIPFVEAQISLEDFARALTGLAYVPVAAEYNNLENVGKFKVSEPRRMLLRADCHDRKEMAEWLLENCQEDGWTIDAYLGSQGSVITSGNKTYLNYRVYKYVDNEPT